ncbi:putative glutathione-specific gamma-glutamylcyclotransferase 2 isoform X2 [Artemia franciscana]|uniref:glutathione-specific gamma-glutamylcyclotransferase n=1 Tax=Artemia franciscana TaxID=6661 RepID=A0AA88HTG7_ARTSF|nr:hypothetical protein QYM36_007095 [Artemia franciscana]KAK2716828.1 hypothetical protein QYM36_007095 [Artemia franciscana]
MYNEFWIFGYGSLCWSPNFEYLDRTVGCIKGFKRRFWQNNTVQRGTIDKAETWGVAFKVKGDAALKYLGVRECLLGGYITTTGEFHPKEGGSPLKVLVYVATQKSQHWAGKAPTKDIALQIANAQGVNGHNVEYLLRLAEFMRTEAPEVRDRHLFELESIVVQLLGQYSEENSHLMECQGDKTLKEERAYKISCAAS